ncbi:class I SAM-dependent methyltransferase, partial [Lujinxingia vulgaris]
TPELPATPDPEAPRAAEAAPETAAAPAETTSAGEPAGDSEMQGLVKELLEEKKAKAQGPRTKRLRPRDVWFQEVFSEEYLRTIPASIGERTEQEVEFIRKSLKLKRGSRILDLACGFGRHAIGLAEEGYEMVGVDLSMPLLQKALADARQRSTNVKFIHGDMRELNFNEVFDGCYVWDTSVGYFDDRTNLRVFQGIQRALKPGGRILVDVINRDYVVRETPTRLWWEGEGCIFLEESEFDFQTSTLHAKRSFIYEDNSPPLEQNSYIRLYNVHELRQMLHVAGFNVLEISGERFTRGYFLGASSRRVIVLAEKRARKDTM